VRGRKAQRGAGIASEDGDDWEGTPIFAGTLHRSAAPIRGAERHCKTKIIVPGRVSSVGRAPACQTSATGLAQLGSNGAGAPVADRIAFDLLQEREFSCGDVVETRQGVCRLGAGLARELGQHSRGLTGSGRAARGAVGPGVDEGAGSGAVYEGAAPRDRRCKGVAVGLQAFGTARRISNLTILESPPRCWLEFTPAVAGSPVSVSRECGSDHGGGRDCLRSSGASAAGARGTARFRLP
jgi:hypothetical protein